MWEQKSPVLFLDNYLVWAYISLIHDLNRDFPPRLFLKIFKKSNKQKLFKKIKRISKLQECLEDYEISCNCDNIILSCHEIVAIAFVKGLEVSCIKSKKVKNPIIYEKDWITSKINQREFLELEKIISDYKTNLHIQSSP